MQIWETLNYKNANGNEVNLSLNLNDIFILEKFEGRDGLKNTIITAKGIGQYGETYLQNNVECRYIMLSGKIFDIDREYCKRLLYDAFNLVLDGILTYTNERTKKSMSIKCNVEYCKTNINRGILEFTISLKCCDPFFKGEAVEHQMALLISKLRYPVELKSTGIEYSQKNDKQMLLTNDGTVPTGVIITIIKKTGAENMVNPYIRNNTTGDNIKINTELAIGEKLIINTNYGSKQVLKVASDGTVSNALGLLDLTSKFFLMQVGDNLIEYGALNDEQGASVFINYSNLYQGV